MSDWPEIEYRYPLVGRAKVGTDGVLVDLIDKHAEREVRDRDLLFVQRVVEDDGTPDSVEQLRHDVEVLAAVGRMYLDALDDDPENEMLTLPEAMRVTEIREAVERVEAKGVER